MPALAELYFLPLIAKKLLSLAAPAVPQAVWLIAIARRPCAFTPLFCSACTKYVPYLPSGEFASYFLTKALSSSALNPEASVRFVSTVNGALRVVAAASAPPAVATSAISSARHTPTAGTQARHSHRFPVTW